MATIYKNRVAVFGWGFAAVFLVFLVAMTYVILRDGAPTGYHPVLVNGIMLIFWLGGLGLSAYVANKACVRVAVREDGNVSVRLLYPLKKEVREVSSTDIKLASVVESRDDEGDPYFYVRFFLLDGTAIDLSEGHDRAACEAVCARFNAELRQRVMQ